MGKWGNGILGYWILDIGEKGILEDGGGGEVVMLVQFPEGWRLPG